MQFNQFSYIPTNIVSAQSELNELGFKINSQHPSKKQLKSFLEHYFFLYEDKEQAFENLAVNNDYNAWEFFNSDMELTAEIFYHVSLQILGFIPNFDYSYDKISDFIESIHFPIKYDSENIILNIHQLLATRTKSGNTLIDQLVSDDFIPEDNTYHFFNGKSLATFSQKDFIKEVVYVESPVDTDDDGQKDLVRVSILRPKFKGRVPAIMMQSPYHHGVNEIASDKALHKMETELLTKSEKVINTTPPAFPDMTCQLYPDLTESSATQKLGHIPEYTLNTYLLARGFANLYVSGIGTLESEGFMTSGDYQQVAGFKAVVDWLNGRATAFSSLNRKTQVKASWATGKVATSGISYLGTLSNALATTGVDGLEVIIAEAGISSWYDYYRENGLVRSPGGFPGEDLDSLAAFTYSRDLLSGDYLKGHTKFKEKLKTMTSNLDRSSGNYNQFWHDRNYLPYAHNVKCQVVFTHGTQDWNVKPIHVYNMFHSLPTTVKKTLFLHNGAHVYMNNWQSIDFRESMNCLLSQKLLGYSNNFELPSVVWQDNIQEQNWKVLPTFSSTNEIKLPLGKNTIDIKNTYPELQFKKYCKSFQDFKNDLYNDKAQQATLDIAIPQDILINGKIQLQVKVKSNINKGLLSVQVLDFGQAKRLSPHPITKERDGVDNGRYLSRENVMELAYTDSPHRLLSTAHVNLQNAQDNLKVQEIYPNQWQTFILDLQPTIYQLKKGDTLRVIFYTTDFELTIRDNVDYNLTLDLSEMQLILPTE